ncbi:MAG: hypothetical protein JOY71_04880 [Acetobacteraceae bacterium]|nr:hypothetical protein [Acetobacteraceae bacterium]
MTLSIRRRACFELADIAVLEAAWREGDLHVGGRRLFSTLAEAATIDGL